MSQFCKLICDKCKNDIIISNSKSITNNSAKICFWDVDVPRGENVASRIDLCPECAEKFVNWLESELSE